MTIKDINQDVSLYMTWLFSPNIRTKHGFSTRHGGFSESPFNSMNLGGSDDDPEAIAKNRKAALEKISIEPGNLSLLKQVHGNVVHKGMKGVQTGDAHVTNEKNIALVVGIADCYPLLFHDPVNHVIGAAHAGWRGTVSLIGRNTIKEMIKLGADKKNIRVAIGQGISCEKFEVGEEVIIQFKNAGFSEMCFNANRIDLLQANKEVLIKEGISENNIWSMNRCTTGDDFFSYRRDKGITGRMWAVISL